MRYKKQIILFVIISVLLSFSVLYWAGTFSENGNQTNENINGNETSSVMWTKNYGSTSAEVAYSLVETSDGGYALAGYTNDWDNPEKNDNFWLVKTDANGNMEWNQTYDKGFHETARSLVETVDGGFALAGYINYLTLGRGSPSPSKDVWLVKTDKKGNMEWNKIYGGVESDSARSLILTSDGGYAIAGGTYSFGAGDNDFWLIKTDPSGNMEWNQTYGDIGTDSASCVVQTNDGGFALAGSKESFDNTDTDFLLIKTDANGNMMWNQTYGETNIEYASSLVVTSDGGYAIAGSTGSYEFLGSRDYWLIKTDTNGNMEWNQTHRGPDSESASIEQLSSLVMTSDGGFAMLGLTYLTDPLNASVVVGHQVWLVKTDVLGNIEWNQTYTGDDANSLVKTSDGGYAFAGETNSFGTSRPDFWLVKTDEHGNIPESPFSPSS